MVNTVLCDIIIDGTCNILRCVGIVRHNNNIMVFWDKAQGISLYQHEDYNQYMSENESIADQTFGA